MLYFVMRNIITAKYSEIEMTAPREDLMASVEESVERVFGPRSGRRRRPADRDLTLGQLDVLHAIRRLDAPSMSDLCRELDLHPSTLTGIIDKLVAAGKVERRDDPDDRRVVRVVLTPQGRRDHERHRRERRARLHKLLAALNDAELVEVQRALAVLGEAAERVSPE
jgi:DNA-binding MarR family transcriptional regulator